MSTTGNVQRVPDGAPAGSSSPVAGRCCGTAGAHHRSGSGPRSTSVPGRSTTPVAGSSASRVNTSSEAAAQRSTASAGNAWYGNHTAAATADVVRSTGSAVTTRTRCPARASARAQVSPITPPPITATVMRGRVPGPFSAVRLLLRRGGGVGRGGLHVADLVLLHRLRDDVAVHPVPVGQRGERPDDDRLGVDVEVPAQR